MQEQIYQLIEQNEITWKSLLLDLVRNEHMDPWDVNISLLTQKYIQKASELKQADLIFSGKVLLAAALLLKLKSKRLLSEDLDEFDRLLAGPTEEQFADSLEAELLAGEEQGLRAEIPELHPSVPLPRQRKVSVLDLVRALEKALEVRHRRILRLAPPAPIAAPERKFDVTAAITELHLRITSLFGSHGKLQFSDLLRGGKQDLIYTIIPLLHLANQRNVDLYQEIPFGEIGITPVHGGIVEHGKE